MKANLLLAAQEPGAVKTFDPFSWSQRKDKTLEATMSKFGEYCEPMPGTLRKVIEIAKIEEKAIAQVHDEQGGTVLRSGERVLRASALIGIDPRTTK